ncbi:DNA-J related domain-containing protein [Bermanella sp. R86510]|uniref:DNA-J related domain-containing protein n=1 Tax=unclassified Bermanella TaxID=2627862 RepID=UPI0037C86E26
MFNFDLSQDIEYFLLQQGQCKEYDIIQYLQSIKRFPKGCLDTSIGLFRSHFLVFNSLYRLQETLAPSYQLFISPLRITLTSSSENSAKPNNAHISEHDPLRLFYLDLDRLNRTDELQVDRLLNEFWIEYEHFQKHPNTAWALEALELDEKTHKIDKKTIKQQYRRLVMKHHPDRGGDSETLVKINKAVECLSFYYH